MPSRDRADCSIEVDGHVIDARTGQSLASALVGSGAWAIQRNPVSGELRGPYCGMGVCFECEVQVVDLGTVRSCLIEVADGMVVRTSSASIDER